MKKIDYDEIINRFGYFRNKANLSARDLSERLDYNPQFVSTIESKKIELKVSTLLKFFDVVDITPQDFFYLGKEYNKENKYILELFAGLSEESKSTIIDLMTRLK